MDPTDARDRLELPCAWDEQRGRERIGPLVLFASPVPERAAQTGRNAAVEPLDRPNALDGLIRCRRGPGVPGFGQLLPLAKARGAAGLRPQRGPYRAAAFAHRRSRRAFRGSEAAEPGVLVRDGLGGRRGAAAVRPRTPPHRHHAGDAPARPPQRVRPVAGLRIGRPARPPRGRGASTPGARRRRRLARRGHRLPKRGGCNRRTEPG